MENELKVTEKRSLSAALVQSGNVMNCRKQDLI